MCYNCGCGLPDDPMGKEPVSKGGPSLIEEDIESMAKGWGMSVRETKEEMIRMLQKHPSSD